MQVTAEAVPAMQEIYERLEELDPTSFETDAIKLLTGLGFEQKMLQRQTKVCPSSHLHLHSPSCESFAGRGLRASRGSAAAYRRSCQQHVVEAACRVME